MQDLQDKFPNAELIGGDAQYEALMAQVVGLIEAPENGLALPLDIRGTAFQQRVWQALRAIPVGETVSYADIARRIGAPKAVRAVAGACAANVLAVAIPVTGWCAMTAPCPAIAGRRAQASLAGKRGAAMSGPLGARLAELTGRRLNANSMRRAARGCRACSAKTCAASWRRSTRTMRTSAAAS